MKQTDVDQVREAMELVLTDVEWFPKSPTKRVITKALHLLDGKVLVDEGTPEELRKCQNVIGCFDEALKQCKVGGSLRSIIRAILNFPSAIRAVKACTDLQRREGE